MQSHLLMPAPILSCLPQFLRHPMYAATILMLWAAPVMVRETACLLLPACLPSLTSAPPMHSLLSCPPAGRPSQPASKPASQPASEPACLPNIHCCLLACLLQSLGHLLLAVFLTSYILLAIPWEEADIMQDLGPAYAHYRAAVPALIPSVRPYAPQPAKRAKEDKVL